MKSKIIKAFRKMKSEEYTCDEGIFGSTGNNVILSKDHEPFFTMMTVGKGTLVEAH